MIKYVIDNNGTLKTRNAKGFKPPNAVGVLPSGEDIRWMEWDGSNLTVNSATKASVEAADAAQAVIDAQIKAIENEYGILDNVVRQRAGADLFALSSESATANYLELVMMKDDPTFFSTQGLMAEVDVKESDLITKIVDKGEPLDTVQLCTDYATRLIEIAREYAVYRHKKKDEFRAFKDSL